MWIGILATFLASYTAGDGHVWEEVLPLCNTYSLMGLPGRLASGLGQHRGHYDPGDHEILIRPKRP